LQLRAPLRWTGGQAVSTWICHLGRNLWPRRFATGLWRFERLHEAGQKFVPGPAPSCGRRVASGGFASKDGEARSHPASLLPGRADTEFIRFVASIDTPCSGCRDIRSAEPSGGTRRWQVPRCANL